MKKAVKLKVNPEMERSYRAGYPLLTEDSVLHLPKESEGQIFELMNHENQLIGKGYLGKQNKGRGWILTNEASNGIDQRFFEEKLRTAFAERQTFFQDPDTTAFRVFNGEGDGIGGLTIDYFAQYYLITWYSEGIYHFKDEVVQSLTNLVPFKGVYEKKRFAVKGTYIDDDDFVIGERAAFPLIIKENGIHFAVYLNDGAMVGIFLDQRDVRKTIRDHYAKGKKVLNTFSYTGAFSVAAALGGAASTTSVDLANRSKDKTIEQFSLNEVDYAQQHIIVEDVFNYFKYAVRKQLKFDMVILDPPSFARSKKHTFSAGKDYPKLLEQAIVITEKEGIIVASTNCSTFDRKKFKTFIDKAFKETGDQYSILEEHGLPKDFKTIKEFKEGNYLKVVIMKKLT